MDIGRRSLVSWRACDRTRSATEGGRTERASAKGEIAAKRGMMALVKLSHPAIEPPYSPWWNSVQFADVDVGT